MGNETSQQVKLGESIENDINVTWKKSEKEAPFPARDGHCAASVGNKVYFFGGVISVDADGYETNELISFDIENGSWSKVAAKGDTPPARFAATMSAVGTSLFLFGGLSQDSGWFDDVHKFDTESQTWSVVQAEGEAPSPRDKLASTVIENDIYVFGGFGPQEDHLEEDDDDNDEEWEEQGDAPEDQQAAQFGWFNDLYVFNTVTNTWSNPMQMNLQKPTPRAAMAMCAVDKYICIFGGRDSEARRNDIHIFNTVSRKWESLSISGRLPEPRSFHTATTVGKRVVVLGGRGAANQHFDDFNIFDVDTMQWLQPVVQGTKPAARGVHTATVVGDHLVVFGGSSEFNPDMNQCLKYFNDLHHISMSDVLSGAAIEKENQENISDNIQSPDTKAVHKAQAASPKGDSVCLYYNTPGGCRFGHKCQYRHTKEKPPQCRFYGILGGCRYGDRCMYSHELPSDMPFSKGAAASTLSKKVSALLRQQRCLTCREPAVVHIYHLADTSAKHSPDQPTLRALVLHLTLENAISAGDLKVDKKLVEVQLNMMTLEEGEEPDLTDCKEPKLTHQNVGYQMLKKMGWSEGHGLGSKGQGITTPVKIADVKRSACDIEHLAMKLPTPGHKAEVDTANSETHSSKSKITELKCGWCSETIKSPDMRAALGDHYRQALLKLNPKHLHFVKNHDEFNDHNISCRICSREFERIVDFLQHTKSKIGNDKNVEDQMMHTKLVDALVVPFVEKDLGELDDLDLRNRLMLILLTAYYCEDEDVLDDSSSDRLLQLSAVNTMRGEALKKKIEERKANIEMITKTYAWRFGPGGCAYDSDIDSDDGYLGYTSDMIEELMCQGIKPWDEEADAALAVIYGGVDFGF